PGVADRAESMGGLPADVDRHLVVLAVVRDLDRAAGSGGHQPADRHNGSGFLLLCATDVPALFLAALRRWPRAAGCDLGGGLPAAGAAGGRLVRCWLAVAAPRPHAGPAAAAAAGRRLASTERALPTASRRGRASPGQ